MGRRFGILFKGGFTWSLSLHLRLLSLQWFFLVSYGDLWQYFIQLVAYPPPPQVVLVVGTGFSFFHVSKNILSCLPIFLDSFISRVGVSSRFITKPRTPHTVSHRLLPLNVTFYLCFLNWSSRANLPLKFYSSNTIDDRN